MFYSLLRWSFTKTLKRSQIKYIFSDFLICSFFFDFRIVERQKKNNHPNGVFSPVKMQSFSLYCSHKQQGLLSCSY